MKSYSLPVLAVTMLLNGCSTPILYFNAAPKSEQKLVSVPPSKTTFGVDEIKDGIQSEVLFTPTAGNSLFNGTAVFSIFTKNLEREPFLFSAANVHVIDKDGREVKVLTIQQLVNKLQANKTKQEWGLILASSMLSAIAAAPYATTQQSGTYSGYTSQGQYVTGTYVGTQQNKTVEYLAQQQNNARIESFSDEMSAALSRALMNVRR